MLRNRSIQKSIQKRRPRNAPPNRIRMNPSSRVRDVFCLSPISYFGSKKANIIILIFLHIALAGLMWAYLGLFGGQASFFRARISRKTFVRSITTICNRSGPSPQHPGGGNEGDKGEFRISSVRRTEGFRRNLIVQKRNMSWVAGLGRGLERSGGS